MSQTINVNVTIPGGGGSVDPLRVPQYLSAAESSAAVVVFATSVALPWASGTYDAPVFTLANQNPVGDLVSDYFGVDGDGAVAILKPGIYAFTAQANYEDNTAGTFRACELYVSSSPVGVLCDNAPMDSPLWESTMGTVNNFQELVVPSGTTVCNAYVYLAHDAGVSLDIAPNLIIRPVAVFEALA